MGSSLLPLTPGLEKTSTSDIDTEDSSLLILVVAVGEGGAVDIEPQS